MTVDSVSSYSLYQSTLRDAGKVMADLARQQTQVSSGVKAQDFSGMASDTEPFLSLDSKMTRNTQYINNNKIANIRLESTRTALDNVISTAREIDKNITLRSSGGLNGSFGELITGNWQTVANQLNTSVNGRYLFSGTKTDIPPVNTNSFPTNKETGVPDDSYYNGGKDNLSFRPQDNMEMSYDVRADHPAVQKLFSALALAKKADAANDQQQLKDAQEMIDASLEELTSLKATVDAKLVTLDNINQRQTAQQTYWKGLKEELINTDLVSVSTEVAVNQGILTAAFQVFAKINSLRLSDFLR